LGWRWRGGGRVDYLRDWESIHSVLGEEKFGYQINACSKTNHKILGISTNGGGMIDLTSLII